MTYIEIMSTTNQTQSIGRYMIFAMWILILVGLFFYFQTTLDQQVNPNQRLQSTLENGRQTVVLQRNRYGHYVASGQINAQPVQFFLDTGATVVSVPERIADQLGLKKGAVQYSNTANGTIQVYSTVLDSISLGGITLNNIRATINPYMNSEDILLGMSFLKNLDFSQQGDRLTLSY